MRGRKFALHFPVSPPHDDFPSPTPDAAGIYDRLQSYQWNYEHPPDVVEVPLEPMSGQWTFCGRPVGSPLGMPAGPLLNGRWILYYAGLGLMS
ncbi:MAG: hypothetical protein CM1200mP2_44740 [Planctomycetaceae bacterium]|nr:MAG: hypothetical protein CM1200mP2_44740 [Planctomycetaceae bacterium]